MSVQTDADRDSEHSSAEQSDGSATEISKDDAFHILQNARRRAVLRYLAEHDDTDRFVMRDIAEEVAAWEHDTTVQQLVSDERQRVYIALYQSHLPKLDKHGVIDYNQSRGVVERTELTEVFEPYIDDGLHADSGLSAPESPDSDTESQESGLTTAVSTLFRR
ncbi:DUF7344 domain-containing protein [Halorarius litoreus]|uniref:DUF7344 domain-containing protein n=1 Tax=Halorarius litoreus TaxID=2962676 RepID=UPI0020CC5D5C|nr:hypothetical protein [Halorarius litoreus]